MRTNPCPLKTEYKEGKSPHARYVYLLKNTYQPLVVMIGGACENKCRLLKLQMILSMGETISESFQAKLIEMMLILVIEVVALVRTQQQELLPKS